MKRLIAILLCALMVVPQAAIGSLVTAFAESISGESAPTPEVEEVEAVEVENSFPIRMEVVGTQPIIENVDGWWENYYDEESDEYVRWFYYECAQASADVIFYYEDGTTQQVNVHDISGFTFFSDQSYHNQWLPGNTYEAVLSYGGEDYYRDDNPISCTYSITIAENPVERIEIGNRSVVYEGTCGYYADYEVGYPGEDNYESGVYFWYDPWCIVDTIIVYYKDGTTEEVDINNVGGVSIGYDQGYDDQWTVGNSYDITYGYYGAETVYSVEIMPTPVRSIEIVSKNDIIEGTNCWMNSYWDENDNYCEYEFYDPNSFVNEVKVNYNDGTSEIKSIYELDGRSIYTGQNYLNQWTADNTYQVTLWYAGVSCDFNINVISDPISSIEIYEYRNLRAGVDGSYYTYRAENGDTYSYFYYHLAWVVDSVKVNYADGSYEYRTLDSFDSFGWEDYQGSDNQWLPGNSYPVTLTIGNHSVDFEIYVEPSDVESIEILEIKDLMPGQDDWETEEWVDGEYQTYNHFSPYNAVRRLRIIYKDGTSWEGYPYELDNYNIDAGQGYYNQWTAGNTYEATFMYRGATCTFNINVVENPVKSIEVVETQPIYENINGFYNWGYSSEYNDNIEYFQYYPWDAILTVRINYSDGTNKTIDYDEWRREEDASIYHGQSANNQWHPGNTYTATLNYSGASCEFPVVIFADPIESFEIYEFETVVEGVDGWYEHYWDENNRADYWFYYPMYNVVSSVKINYIDGTYEILGYDQWRERSDSYLEWDQSSNNPWLAGNTYTVRMGVGNHIIDVPVYITPNNVESIVPYNVNPLIEGSNSMSRENVDGEWIEYPYYYAENAFYEVLITYTDGTTEIKNLEQLGEYRVTSDQSYYNQWTAGNTYMATFMCMGREANFAVTIEADPVESIEIVETNILYKDVNGWISNDYSSELGYWVSYFHYDIWQAIEAVKVNYKDGTSEIVSLNQLSNMGTLGENTWQSADNQWQPGNTYTATLYYNNVHSCEFEITIGKREVVDLEFYQFDDTIKEGSVGSWNSEYVDGEWKDYFVYDVGYNIGWLTVYYSDGTSREYYCREVEIETIQNYYKQWLPGNSYPVTVTVDGYTEILYIYVEPTNVERFEILETKPLYEGDGYLESYYDDELGEYVEYIFYSAWDAIELIKIYYKDGTTEICHYGDLGERVEGSTFLYSNQGAPDGIWTVGNTYTASLSCGMFWDDFEISIIENPVESIEVVETTVLEEFCNGWYNEYWDENGYVGEWFYYSAEMALGAVKINYKDGTSEIIPADQMNSRRVLTAQSYHNQWTVGNAYTATLEYMGRSCEYNVTIVAYTPYNYIVQDGGVYITGVKDSWYFENNNITDFVIPSEIEGYPVVGINSLSAVGGGVKTITIPASVKYISGWSFSSFYNAEIIYIEGTETVLSPETFSGGMFNLREFVVNEDHPEYTVIDGVIFDKNVTTIIAYPVAKGNTYELPVTISDMSFMQYYQGVNFIIHPDSTEFVVENGITYDKAKTQIISCDKTVSGDYVMPETVEYIPEMMFQGCENLTSVVMSPLVTNIAYATFDNCPNLQSVILPAELQMIGHYAFSDCTSLESVELPSKLAVIEYNAFYNVGLKSLTVPGNVEYIGSNCFKNSQLETIKVEEAFADYGTYIGYGAFENNVNLKTVVLAEGVSGIGSYVFSNCESLTEINIPDSATMFGEYIFENCDSLTYLPIGANQDHIPAGEFYGCDGLVDVVIPEQVVAVLDNAFRGCGNLKTVEMPENLTYFERYVFADCESLTELPLSANQTYIAYGEFQGCTGLENVVLPERITEICAFAFRNCVNLESINLSDNINYIDRGAFQGCTSLREAYIGNKVESIEMYTYKNSGITEVVIGENVQFIGYEAFMNTKLTSVDIPESVTEIAYFAFFGCEDLAEINMPETLVELGGHSFGATQWYKDQPEGPVYLGSSLYNYKGDIPEGTELYVEPGTLAISGHAFESGCLYSNYWDYRNDERYTSELYDRSGLKAIHLPEGLKIIGDHAFYNCSGLTEIYLPASLTDIYPEAFYGADNIETVYYSGTAEQWSNINILDGHEIFDNCEVIFEYEDETQPEKPAFEKGDIDGNGSINSVDLFKMNLFVKQIVLPTDEEAAAADIDGNGKVNSVDMFYLKYRILKGEWSIK